MYAEIFGGLEGNYVMWAWKVYLKSKKFLHSTVNIYNFDFFLPATLRSGDV